MHPAFAYLLLKVRFLVLARRHKQMLLRSKNGALLLSLFFPGFNSENVAQSFKSILHQRYMEARRSVLVKCSNTDPDVLQDVMLHGQLSAAFYTSPPKVCT